MTPKGQATIRKKIDTLNFIKIKNFCASKDTTNEVKRQPREWEKLFTNHVSGKKNLYLDYVKNFYNLTITHFSNGQKM